MMWELLFEWFGVEVVMSKWYLILGVDLVVCME